MSRLSAPVPPGRRACFFAASPPLALGPGRLRKGPTANCRLENEGPDFRELPVDCGVYILTGLPDRLYRAEPGHVL